ncbi:TPA: polysaccharide biosynthesis protein, partial [Escherichia coli]
IPGLHLSWLMSIGMITIPTGIIVFFLSFIVRFSGNRLHDIIVLGLISILALMVSIVSCWLIKRMNLGV